MKERVRDGFPGQRMTALPPFVRRRAQTLPVVRDLYVTDIGHFPSAAHHYVDRSDGRPEAILIYCTTGAGWCEVAGHQWALKDGWALVIPPGTPHVYGALDALPWSIYWAHVAGAQTAAYLEMLGISADSPMLHVPDTQLVGQAFEEAYSHVHHGYTDESLVGLSTTMVRLLGLLRCHQRAPNEIGRRREEKILQSIAYMREHLDESRSLAELAGAAAMSVSHYSHVFKDQTNTSPHNFFVRLKMQRACELLDTTNATVREVGASVGYDDQFHFCRMFKKVIGKPPSGYREMVKG